MALNRPTGIPTHTFTLNVSHAAAMREAALGQKREKLTRSTIGLKISRRRTLNTNRERSNSPSDPAKALRRVNFGLCGYGGNGGCGSGSGGGCSGNSGFFL
jgi:hypothetical protein